MPGRVIDRDRGMKRIKRFFRTHAGRGEAVNVGVQGQKGQENYPGAPMTNAALMAIHEFGAKNGRPPERKPMRGTFDRHVAKYKRQIDRISDRALITGTVRTELFLLGEEYRADILDEVKAGLKPDLAESTIRRRHEQKDQPGVRQDEQGNVVGEAKPLWDTGQLVGSISVEFE